MQLTAIGTVAITIVLLGAFLFVRAAMAGFGDRLMDQIEISAYLKPDASATQIASIQHLISSDPRVLSVDYVSKKQGLAELRARTRGEIDTSLLTENPLPDKLRVRVRQPELVPAVAAERSPHRRRRQRGLRRDGRPAFAAARRRAATRRHRGDRRLFGRRRDHHLEHDSLDRLRAAPRDRDHAARRRDEHVHSHALHLRRADRRADRFGPSPFSCSPSRARRSGRACSKRCRSFSCRRQRS